MEYVLLISLIPSLAYVNITDYEQTTISLPSISLSPGRLVRPRLKAFQSPVVHLLCHSASFGHLSIPCGYTVANSLTLP